MQWGGEGAVRAGERRQHLMGTGPDGAVLLTGEPRRLEDAAVGLERRLVGRALLSRDGAALPSVTPVAATPAPFVLAGGLKIAYDLALFFRFRRVKIQDGA